MISAPTAGFEGSSGHIDGLIVGHEYNLAIEAWNDEGPGLPKSAGAVMVGWTDAEPVPRDSHCPPPKDIGTPPATDSIDANDPKPPPTSSRSR